MIRDASSDPVATSPGEALRAASLADHAWGPMDGKEAAAFLKVSEAQFGRLAPRLPRHKRAGLGYRYLRSELLAWLRAGDEATREASTAPRRQHDGNVESSGVGLSKKKGGRQRVKRLV